MFPVLRGASALAAAALTAAAMLPAWAANAPPSAASQARRIALTDLPRIVRVGDVAISPDGGRIAFIVSHANMKSDRYDSEIELYDVADKTTRPLTFERKSLASPAWSPDGGRIAFLALVGEGDNAAQQIFVLDLRGGDARQITHTKKGVEQFAWSPRGNVLAYVAADPAPNAKSIKEHLDAFQVGDQAYTDRAAPTSNHIWLVNEDGSSDRRLTRGSWSIPSAQPPSSPGPPLSWSPDGTQICFTQMPNAYDADSDRAVVAVVDVATGNVRRLTSHGKLEGYGEWSPDGKYIAYWYPKNGDPAAVNHVFVAPANGGSGSDVTDSDIDTNVQRAIWMPNGSSLLISGHWNADAALWIKPLHDSARRIELDGVQPSQGFWLDASVAKTGAIAFAGSTPTHPTELYYMSSASAAPERLTGYNDAIASLNLGVVKAIVWPYEGYREDGIVTVPPDYDPAKKHPLVLVIHGGPNSSSTTGFNSLNQLLAARGYIVFNPNYRGSDNLGAKYWYAIVNDSGAGPGRDVMAGIAAVEKAFPIDTNRIAVSGWSYGGYMTSWMIGHYHIWKAAVSGAAVNDLIAEYSLADNGVQDRFTMYGSPFIRGLSRAYREQSPLEAASHVTTPTLILGDVGDERVPIVESYEFYHALKDNGTTVQFWAYPVGGHFPSDPVRSQDVFRRWIAWLSRYLSD